jgi:hypothetical protein
MIFQRLCFVFVSQLFYQQVIYENRILNTTHQITQAFTIAIFTTGGKIDVPHGLTMQ